jgi:hypothetical protein
VPHEDQRGVAAPRSPHSILQKLLDGALWTCAAPAAGDSVPNKRLGTALTAADYAARTLPRR